jgi:hypothetical protein
MPLIRRLKTRIAQLRARSRARAVARLSDGRVDQHYGPSGSTPVASDFSVHNLPSSGGGG